MMEELDDLPVWAKNLRWFVYQHEKDPTKWAEWIEKETKTTIERMRAHALLMGAKLRDDLARICDITRWDAEELQTAHHYQGRDSIWRENLNYLLDAIPRGANQAAAKSVGVRKEQITRWRSGEQKPTNTNLRALLRFHGIDPELNLEEVPLYLSMEPISGYAQKKWLEMRVKDIHPEELTKHFPSLWKILKDDEVD